MPKVVESGVDRLRRRMAAYRERNREQEKVQEDRDQRTKSHSSVGYNLFCLELNKTILPDSSPSSIVPVPSLFGSATDVSPAEEPLCWLCGETLPSMAGLNQHAADVHFNQWLAAFIEWKHSDPPCYRYPYSLSFPGLKFSSLPPTPPSEE